MDRKKLSLSLVQSISVAALAVLLASAAVAQTERVIFDFNGTTTSGGPQDLLVADASGNFYGTTFGGGSASLGIVYELSPPVSTGGAWTQTILYNFTGPDGSQPNAGLTIDGAGNLYGTTVYGGNGPCIDDFAVIIGCGTVFELSPPAVSGGTWAESVLYNFQYGSDSGAPRALVTFDHAGNLYGTASGDGPFDYPYNDAGAVFELSPPSLPGGAWAETTLYNFPAGSRGATPFAPVVFDSSGNLYSTAYFGGNSGCVGNLGCGVVFELSPPSIPGGSWTQTLLHSFVGGNFDGSNPAGGVAITPYGTIIGTASKYGSSADAGTVYALQPPSSAGGAWTYATIHVFGGAGDGATPRAGLTAGAGRTVYGTTTAGGSLNNGIVFELAPPASAGAPWTETVLHSFQYSSSNKTDGAIPQGGVIIHDGALFGTTSQGGPNKAGTVYRITR